MVCNIVKIGDKVHFSGTQHQQLTKQLQLEVHVFASGAFESITKLVAGKLQKK